MTKMAPARHPVPRSPNKKKKRRTGTKQQLKDASDDKRDLCVVDGEFPREDAEISRRILRRRTK